MDDHKSDFREQSFLRAAAGLKAKNAERIKNHQLDTRYKTSVILNERKTHEKRNCVCTIRVTLSS